MTYQDLAWPGITHSLKAIASARRKDAALLKQVQEAPKLFRHAERLKRTLTARIADYSAGMFTLREAQIAVAPQVKARVRRRSIEGQSE